MFPPEGLEKFPLRPLVENVRPDDQIEALAQVIGAPIHQACSNAIGIRQAVDPGEEQGGWFEVREEDAMSEPRRDGSGQSHPAPQVEDRERRGSIANHELTDRRRAVPEFRPVGEMELFVIRPGPAGLLQAILFIGDAIEDDVGVGDLEKIDCNRADVQRFNNGLVFQKTDAVKQTGMLT